MLNIYVDADACPVKENIFKVAKRYSLKVFVVTNVPIFLPKADWIKPVIVEKRFDAADDWIAEHIEADDILITNDLLLAERGVRKKARVLDPRGRILDEDNIGEALSMRELLSELRQRGAMDLGPKKMGKNHRSSFLSALDEVINEVKRNAKGRP